MKSSNNNNNNKNKLEKKQHKLSIFNYYCMFIDLWVRSFGVSLNKLLS